MFYHFVHTCWCQRCGCLSIPRWRRGQGQHELGICRVVLFRVERRYAQYRYIHALQPYMLKQIGQIIQLDIIRCCSQRRKSYEFIFAWFDKVSFTWHITAWKANYFLLDKGYIYLFYRGSLVGKQRLKYKILISHVHEKNIYQLSHQITW